MGARKYGVGLAGQRWNHAATSSVTINISKSDNDARDQGLPADVPICLSFFLVPLPAFPALLPAPTQFVIPLMLVFIVARSVGNRINEGIYDTQISIKKMPFLGQVSSGDGTEREVRHDGVF